MSFLSSLKFKANQKAPEILLIAGIGGVVVSTVMFVKQTPKAIKVLEEKKKDRFECDALKADVEKAKEVNYTEEDYKRDCKIINIQTIFKLVKTYAIPAGMMAGSLFCIAKSYSVLKGRHVATAATLAAVMGEFNDYRKRVIERFDEKTDRDLRYDIKTEEVEEIVTDDKGKEKTIKKEKSVIGVDHGDYTYYFDSTSRHWMADPELNKDFLLALERQFNLKLKQKGYIFLNDVLKALGIQPTQTGQVVGWRYDLENPTGDNQISFGIFNEENETSRRFVNGLEAIVLLDFNCDGYLLDGCLDKIIPIK